MSLIETLYGARTDSPALSRRAPRQGLVELNHVPLGAWSELSNEALEPNAFYHPLWARAVAGNAPGYGGARALVAWENPGQKRLIGCLPVTSAWRALRLPLPVLVAWQAVAPLTTPLLAPDAIADAIHGLLDAAAASGARALMLPALADGPAATALRGVLAERGLVPQILHSHQRARLVASDDPEGWLRSALGPKKRKELRRQRHRLDDDGPVTFEIATRPRDVAEALEQFLILEAAGWKGRRGSGLGQHPGRAAFVRQAAMALSAEGRFEVATLRRAGIPLAAGLVLRHDRRAFFFKVAFDESNAKTSPGVQLTLELTRYFCADTHTNDVDSLAVPEHPMVDHLWHDRLTISDVLVPLRRDDPIAAIAKTAILARDAAHDRARSVMQRLRKVTARR